ncbi:MAG: AAA family ATPase [Gammaproteobacteria bacterium]|nr:AAA family ATPase [Gammaproteobacteria bacterium]
MTEAIRILITGMSGVGKTTIVRALRNLGWHTLDMDEPGWAFFDEHGHQRWDKARLQQLMDEERNLPLFVCGCSEDQVAFYPQFTKIILLSAPQAVIEHRLASRTDNAYGKRPGELRRVLQELHEIEPLLRKRATHEIVTTQPIEAVLARIIALCDLPPEPASGPSSLPITRGVPPKA